MILQNKNQFQYYLDELGKYALFSNHDILSCYKNFFKTFVSMYLRTFWSFELVWYFSIYVRERAKWKYGFAGSLEILKLRKTKVRRPSFANIS